MKYEEARSIIAFLQVLIPDFTPDQYVIALVDEALDRASRKLEDWDFDTTYKIYAYLGIAIVEWEGDYYQVTKDKVIEIKSNKDLQGLPLWATDYLNYRKDFGFDSDVDLTIALKLDLFPNDTYWNTWIQFVIDSSETIGR